ncbi:Glutamyl-tRNA(Gln) amidotransferase subunit C [Planctomycetes bacterium Pan216]|uniref:Aspartyl/glutamyl-tRNA(Asn/Gln) amidotransferase subunit C n=1 Tax=Kolteria novifilia TaxID=2527975 RepID=A0A518B8B1_9BACT|nr:Glutamyl-tRNA(Gln) amidotransferase subunit C [Planctomycetes bacterium Pan216]
MSFSREQVDKVALLSRLELTDEEKDRISQQLGSILDYIEQLGELDTEGVEPLAHCLPIQNVFREDVVEESLSIDEALGNAPKRRDEFFAVPPPIEK